MSVTNQNDALQPVTTSVVETLVQHRDRFKAYLSKRLENEAVAEEILQQALLRAVEKEDEIENEASIVPWFYRVLRNALIDHYRSRASDSKKAEELMQELETTGSKSTAPADELRNAICRCLDGLVETLKPEYAELVRKVDLETKPQEIVAKELKISPNNLSVRLHRARQALRKSLERSCGACSKHACLDCTCR